jgi:hypothetical protein
MFHKIYVVYFYFIWKIDLKILVNSALRQRSSPRGKVVRTLKSSLSKVHRKGGYELQAFEIYFFQRLYFVKIPIQA